jgi:hypothetical protein
LLGKRAVQRELGCDEGTVLFKRLPLRIEVFHDDSDQMLARTRRPSNMLDTICGVICVRGRKIAGEWQNFALVLVTQITYPSGTIPKLRPDLITEGSLSRRPARFGRCCWSWRLATAATLTASIPF